MEERLSLLDDEQREGLCWLMWLQGNQMRG